MPDLNHCITVYKKQLQQGDIREAYAGLVKYVTRLGTTLDKHLAGRFAFGSLFQGYMDYTYFYFTNDFLKKRKLKFGLVLNHPEMRFEIWLLGQTIPLQEKYWQFFKSTKWNQGRTTRPQYSILETVLVEHPDFNNLERLTQQIEERLVAIADEIIADIKRGNLPESI
ncbi:hypothetical protein [Chitinophaga sp.]|uniref:DUF7000 family protein n=1 Tax=Chitinophaga sp. TaxID=1869181 RepID=UPI0026115615|nr:hypothetical protein [uncultured Chitinophaga sp.]